MLLTRLGLVLQTNLQDIRKLSSDSQRENEDRLDSDEEENKLINSVVYILRRREVLLVLDNCEDLLEEN